MRPASAALLLLLGLGLAHPAPARAANLTGDDRGAIASAITGQIDAFRRDDAVAAFGYAAPSIQALFGDAAHFMAMVQQGYAPVYRPRSVHLGDVSSDGDQVMQRVELIGPDGVPATALYGMEREPDGTWRIASCVLLRPEKVTT